MSTRDLWIRDIISYCGFIVLLFLTIGCCVTCVWHRFARKLYQSHLVGFEARCADLAAPYKKELFGELENITSKDEILRSIGRIRILEIGVKTGGNIQYYPDGAYFVGVDWNTKLRDYLTASEYSWQFSHVYLERLIIGDGSSLRLIPSDCVDIVVTTRSLCSADSVEDTLCEIRRVLAPGGKYLFLEHVPDPERPVIRRIQMLLTKTKIWPSLFGNCRLDNDPISHIKRAGFKDLVWKTLTLEGYVSQPNHLFLTRHHVIGTATGPIDSYTPASFSQPTREAEFNLNPDDPNSGTVPAQENVPRNIDVPEIQISNAEDQLNEFYVYLMDIVDLDF